MSLTETFAHRHQSVKEVLKFLDTNPNLKGNAKWVADGFRDTAADILHTIKEDSPELTVGLRKLLEAKDCFVRASLDL